MKKIIQNILRSQGYEIIRCNRFGARAVTDIGALFRGRPLQTIFDVGANQGQTALLYVDSFPEAKIHSFEPFFGAYQELQRVTTACSRVTAVQCALGEAPASETLYVNQLSATNSLLPNTAEAERFQPPGTATRIGETTVKVESVDNYCIKSGVTFIDLLKMDTQGYELHVLGGAEQTIRANNIAVVYSEVLFVPLYKGQAFFHEVYEHLVSRGFGLVNLYDTHYNDDGYLSWCDALFVHPTGLSKRISGLPKSA